MIDLPIVCTLSQEQLEERQQTLIPGLLRNADRVEEVENGYKLHFAAVADVLPAIAEAIEAERRCCQFLRFELIVEPANGPVMLSITGPNGTQQFLADLVR